MYRIKEEDVEIKLNEVNNLIEKFKQKKWPIEAKEDEKIKLPLPKNNKKRRNS